MSMSPLTSPIRKHAACGSRAAWPCLSSKRPRAESTAFPRRGRHALARNAALCTGRRHRTQNWRKALRPQRLKSAWNVILSVSEGSPRNGELGKPLRRDSSPSAQNDKSGFLDSPPIWQKTPRFRTKLCIPTLIGGAVSPNWQVALHPRTAVEKSLFLEKQ